ncbi:MAG: heparinase II/III domain-containing protein, partial [Nannocystaceae bacterium]
MATLPTLLRTLRHLTRQQVVHQLRTRLHGPARKPRVDTSKGLTACSPVLANFMAPAAEGLLTREGVCLLAQAPHNPWKTDNSRGSDNSHDSQTHGWSPPGRDPLWLYTLHYHGWLADKATSVEACWKTIDQWMLHHRQGVGWEPYPTSMRVLHWLGYLGRGDPGRTPADRQRILDSLAAQLLHLADNQERHLDGNHLWTNYAALASAGLGLCGPLAAGLRKRFLPLFVKVVEDQLAADGGHRERTPSYHCLLASQLAGVVSLARIWGPPGSEMRNTAAYLDQQLARMVRVLPAFVHPDMDIALWGDSQLRAPVTPAWLCNKLRQRLPLEGSADAPGSGFHRRCWGPWTVLWNAGGLGLPHQVGHLHGDALALELSLGRERVFVDAGVGTYVPGSARDASRCTPQHNTVTPTTGRIDQHEFWASHRIGGRAQVGDRTIGPEHLGGTVHGY